MAWVSLTEDDVETRMSGDELTSFTTIALASGQSSPVNEIINQTVDMVRGYIAANEKNVLGNGQTIPQRLKAPTLDIIVVELMKRLGGQSVDIDGIRRDSYRDAMRLLERVADGRFRITEPATADTEEQAQSRGTYGGRKHVPITHTNTGAGAGSSPSFREGG